MFGFVERILLPSLGKSLLALGALVGCMSLCTCGLEGGGIDLNADYEAYDNATDRAAFFESINQKREREFAVAKLRADWLESMGGQDALEESLSVLKPWVIELVGTAKEPHPEAEKRAQRWLEGVASGTLTELKQAEDEAEDALTEPWSLTLRGDRNFGSFLAEHAQEFAWSWEEGQIDSAAVLLRELILGLDKDWNQLSEALGDEKLQAELPPIARKALQEAQQTEQQDKAQVFAALLAWKQEEAELYPSPEMFTRATAADLPEFLQDEANWTTNWDEPEIGSDAAKKGGEMRMYMGGFPQTIRRFGPSSNSSFRSQHHDNITLGCVTLHLDTGAVIPMVANRWHVAEDGRTVFFHIDERARYSDGVAVTSEDILTQFYVHMSPHAQDPFGKQYFGEQFVQVTTYGESIFSLTLKTKKAQELMPYYADTGFAPTHFFTEFGPDFVDRYQWRATPTTGAYELDMEETVFGREMTLKRVKDWWRKDLQYTKNRFNADKIHYRVIQDTTKAWEIFRNGDLESFNVGIPEYWYVKSETEPVFDGYIERAVFFNVYPRIPRGLYLNTARAPLDNRDVRIGIAYATDWQRVIEQEFRNDASRLQVFAEGYALLKPSPIQVRQFNPDKAREHFAKAGYTEQGPDGILRKPTGEKLSVNLLCAHNPISIRMLTLLVQQAKLAGLELVLDVQDGEASFKQQQDKEHQLSYTGWGFGPPLPNFYQFLHSSNARGPDGSLKKQTNNIFSWADPKTDELVVAHRDASSLEEVEQLTEQLNAIIHEDALYIPGFTFAASRTAYWRWLCWPEESFSVRSAYDPIESYAWWIDEEKRQETLKAKAAGETFPEVLEVYDQYDSSKRSN